jgi:hypothetical protein
VTGSEAHEHLLMSLRPAAWHCVCACDSLVCVSRLCPDSGGREGVHAGQTSLFGLVAEADRAAAAAVALHGADGRAAWEYARGESEAQRAKTRKRRRVNARPPSFLHIAAAHDHGGVTATEHAPVLQLVASLRLFSRPSSRDRLLSLRSDRFWASGWGSSTSCPRRPRTRTSRRSGRRRSRARRAWPDERRCRRRQPRPRSAC